MIFCILALAQRSFMLQMFQEARTFEFREKLLCMNVIQLERLISCS
jgi:hypothetical protein